MTWKTTSFESVQLNDGLIHEIFITGKERVKLPPEKARKDRAEVMKFSGIEKNRGPVTFLATDSLAKQIDHVPGLYQISWKGKRELKDARTFNVFTVSVWDAGALPEWTENPDGRVIADPLDGGDGAF